MQFRFRATDSRGDLQKGKIAADSETVARQKIEARGWTVLEVRTEVAVNKSSDPQQAPPSQVKHLTHQTAPLAVAGLLILGLLVFGTKLGRSKLAQTESLSTVAAGSRKVVLQGVIPLEPLDAIHINCLGAAVQIDPDLSKLAKPGQQFTSLIEVPPNAGEIVLEVSRSGRRWVVDKLHPTDPPQLNLPPIQPTDHLAISSSPFRSHFTQTNTHQAPLEAEQRKSNEERLLRENEFAKQHGLPVRNSLR